MTYEQLALFHAQEEAMTNRMEDESSRQFAMVKAMEKNRLEQYESRAILLQTGNLTSPVRQLGDVMELAGFMEVMKRDVDRGVNLRLTFETAEKTMDIPNLKCWVARDSRLGRPGRLIGRHYKTAWAT
ncbi:hypothetical protein B5M09_009228 [Aphanomyces astaci]|uniref:Uncharacterized protein n=1 Tax=Aphanomyces astaci TaxID=112090 RepID=A0A425CYA0_APHAT|nr:hypothetical protein B5M09_009228 [Aphanomyces astaci]